MDVIDLWCDDLNLLQSCRRNLCLKEIHAAAENNINFVCFITAAAQKQQLINDASVQDVNIVQLQSKLYNSIDDLVLYAEDKCGRDLPWIVLGG